MKNKFLVVLFGLIAASAQASDRNVIFSVDARDNHGDDQAWLGIISLKDAGALSAQIVVGGAGAMTCEGTQEIVRGKLKISADCQTEGPEFGMSCEIAMPTNLDSFSDAEVKQSFAAVMDKGEQLTLPAMAKVSGKRVVSARGSCTLTELDTLDKTVIRSPNFYMANTDATSLPLEE